MAAGVEEAREGEEGEEGEGKAVSTTADSVGWKGAEGEGKGYQEGAEGKGRSVQSWRSSFSDALTLKGGQRIAASIS